MAAVSLARPVASPQADYQKVVSSFDSALRFRATLSQDANIHFSVQKAVNFQSILHKKSRLFLEISNFPINIIGDRKRSYVQIRNYKIGKGTFKTAYLGFQVIPDTYKKAAVVIKNDGEKHHFKEEALIHQRLNSLVPEIVQCFDQIEWNDQEAMFLQYCNQGNASDFIKKYPNNKKLQPWFAIRAYRIIAKLHQNGFAHRDIKLSNFLLHEDPETKLLSVHLCDLDSVVSLDDLQKRSIKMGTSIYMPPEIIKAQTPDEVAKFSNENWDKWSFGCLLYELFFHEKLPWRGGHNKRLAKEKIIEFGEKDPASWIKKKDLPRTIYLLMLGLFDKDPDKRPSNKEILDLLHGFHEM